MITKLFVNNQVFVVEYCPDTTPDEENVARLISERRDQSPTLDGVREVCAAAGVRARFCRGQQYIGHIYEDGSCDNAVLNC